MAGQAGVRAAKAYVEIGVHSKLQAGLRKASMQLDRFAARVRGVGSSVGSVGTRMTGMGVVGAAAIGGVVKLFAAFDDQMRTVKAVTGATADQFAMLTEEAKRLGRETSFTASEVAGGMVELGRAGFEPREIMDAMGAVLALSRSTGTDLAEAVQIAAGTIRGFNLEAQDMGRVADVLTSTVNGSSQTLTDFGEGIKYVAPLAAAAGESIEDVAAASAILADNFIKGSLAGNAIARAYKNLSGELRQEVLRGLGIESVDANGDLRKLADILAELGERTKDLGSAERLNIFDKLFGRGQAAALNLGKDPFNVEGFNQRLREAQGTAKRTAEDMDSGIGGSFRMLYSAIEGVLIEIGDTLAPIIKGWADSLKGLAGILQRIIEQAPGLATGFLKVTIAAIGGGIALAAIAGALKAIAIGIIATSLLLKGLSIAIGVATAAWKLLALSMVLFNPVTIAISAAIATVVGAVAIMGGSVREAVGDIADSFASLAGYLREAWQGIGDAFVAGNLALAGEIAMQSLRLVFVTALGAIEQLWNDWTTDLANALVVLETTAKSILFNIASWVAGISADIAGGLGMDSVAAYARAVQGATGAFANVQTSVEYREVSANEAQRQRDRESIQAGIASVAARLSELNAQALAEAEPFRKKAEEEDEQKRVIEERQRAAVVLRTPEPELRNLGGVANRGTFSSFVANRIGTRTTYEDRSLALQERAAKAAEAIEAQMEIAAAIGV
jgi:TP901 family phage tail tape measure protein